MSDKIKIYNETLGLSATGYYHRGGLFSNRGGIFSKPDGKGLRFGASWKVGILPFKDFEDMRGREWEWFVDDCYYHMICVRLKNDRDFNSPTSFHFTGMDEAKEFCSLLSRSV
jgi:hypothetical protein